MAREPNPIRWESDVTPAAWLAELAHSTSRVDQFVPAGYAACARLMHPPGGERGTGLPMEMRRALVELLRAETTQQCWFCIPDSRKELDDQGVSERVRLPHGGLTYLLHRGPIERVLVPPPQKPLPFTLREDASPDDMAAVLTGEAQQYTDARLFVRADTRPADLIEALSRLLDDVAATFWWPEDRAWFVSTPTRIRFGVTYVAGSRSLIDRVLATPALEATETSLTESLGVAERESLERRYGPVIARGSEAGHEWTMRGRIGEDGVWSLIDGSGGGGGALPFQDLGSCTLGHFGSVGWRSGHNSIPRKPSGVDGVVSKETASIDVHLTDGSVVRAEILDIGDPRANFFVAFWVAPFDCDKLVARGASGGELETFVPPPNDLALAIDT